MPSPVWKHIPNDEHWLRFAVEVLRVEPWTVEGQFRFMDLNNDSQLTEQELVRFGEKMRREFGKDWPNQDVDSVLAARYYVKWVGGSGWVYSVDPILKVFRRERRWPGADERIRAGLPQGLGGNGCGKGGQGWREGSGREEEGPGICLDFGF